MNLAYLLTEDTINFESSDRVNEPPRKKARLNLPLPQGFPAFGSTTAFNHEDANQQRLNRGPPYPDSVNDDDFVYTYTPELGRIGRAAFAVPRQDFTDPFHHFQPATEHEAEVLANKRFNDNVQRCEGFLMTFQKILNMCKKNWDDADVPLEVAEYAEATVTALTRDLAKVMENSD